MMKNNVGGMDRVLRIILGLVILSLAFIGPKTPWGYIGLVLIFTGLFRWCPAYLPFGFSSSKPLDRTKINK